SGDAIELFLGMDEGNPERRAFGSNDYQLGIGLGTGTGLGWSLLGGGQGTKTLGDISKNIAVTNTTDGYIFELQIPWATIDPSLKVTQGQRISWYIFADDGREASGSTGQDLALGPTGATGPSGDPSV